MLIQEEANKGNVKFLVLVSLILLLSFWGMWSIVKTSTTENQSAYKNIELSNSDKDEINNIVTNFIANAGSFGYTKEVTLENIEETLKSINEETILDSTITRVDKYNELDISKSSKLSTLDVESLIDESEILTLTSFEATNIASSLAKNEELDGDRNKVTLNISFTSIEINNLVSFHDEHNVGFLNVMKKEIPVEGTIILIGESDAWTIDNVSVNAPYTLAFGNPREKGDESLVKTDMIIDEKFSLEE